MSSTKVVIDRLPSGSYRYRVRDSNAKRYDSATFTRTEEDAKRDKPGTAAGDRWAKNQLARFQLGQATAERASIASVVNIYLAQLGRRRPKERPMTKGHIATATRVLGQLVSDHPGIDLNQATATKATIDAWLHGLRGRHGRELAPGTRDLRLRFVQTMIAWAVREGVIARNPIAGLSVQLPNSTLPPVLKLAEARELVALNRTDSPGWLWIMLMLYAGMRDAEARMVKWEDILWTQNVIKVFGKGLKLRAVPMQPELREILLPLGGPEAKVPRMGRIVAHPDYDSRVRSFWWSEFGRVLNEAGIPTKQGIDPVTKRMVRLHPHTCRHSFGSMLLATGLDSMLLQMAMGHENSEMTQHYAQGATMFRSEIEKEGWKPGELRLRPLAQARRQA